ncbi:hypothetical protein [Neisseria sp. CCUG12390]|uniref:hypothetical protein n=1 Tax=Neisseria sp. CCUG12390 TaxID=3392035 RepID=UPI003A0FBF0A
MNKKTLLLYSCLALMLPTLSACAREIPTIMESVELPAAVHGHAYEAEFTLPYSIHVSPHWTIPLNSHFKIEPIHDGSGAHNRFILSNNAEKYVPEGSYEILKLHGHSGGGRSYRTHIIELPVWIFDEGDSRLKYCTRLQPKKDVLMYDCSRLNKIRAQAAQDGTFCQKFPNEC